MFIFSPRITDLKIRNNYFFVKSPFGVANNEMICSGNGLSFSHKGVS